MFVDLKTNGPPIATSKVRLSLHSGKRHRLLRIYIARSVAEPLNLVRPNRAVVLFGYGDAAGIVQVYSSLVPTQGYAISTKEYFRSVYIQIARLPDYLVPRDIGVTGADFYIDQQGSALEIDIPKIMLKPASQHAPLVRTA